MPNGVTGEQEIEMLVTSVGSESVGAPVGQVFPFHVRVDGVLGGEFSFAIIPGAVVVVAIVIAFLWWKKE